MKNIWDPEGRGKEKFVKYNLPTVILTSFVSVFIGSVPRFAALRQCAVGN
jgi:hypothetical protein